MGAIKMETKIAQKVIKGQQKEDKQRDRGFTEMASLRQENQP